LTEPGFSRRARDLLEHSEWNIGNIKLLLYGRHFRLSDKTKLIVGRNEIENERLKKLGKKGDIFLEARDYPGPLGLLKGIPEEKGLKEAASIVASYGKGKFQSSLFVKVVRNGSVQEIEVMPLPREKIREKLI
jgi:predicted ribosome quality control (RQC) complex YloA/Tae2 family protein